MSLELHVLFCGLRMMAEESLVGFFCPTTLTGFGSYLKGKSSIKSASLSLWHNMLACFKALYNGPLEEVKVAEMHQLWLKEKNYSIYLQKFCWKWNTLRKQRRELLLHHVTVKDTYPPCTSVTHRGRRVVIVLTPCLGDHSRAITTC